MTCPFCNSKEEEIILSNKLAYARYDKFPVNPGHILICPKRHVEDFFDIKFEERQAVCTLIDECKKILDKQFKPDGYNIGVNSGEAAGQTIFHVHVHLIPRYKGDIDNPRGGVRGVIPEKRIY